MRRRLIVLLATTTAAALAVAPVASAPAGAVGEPRAGAAVSADFRSVAVDWAAEQAGLRERGTSNCHPRIDRWLRDMRLKPCRPWCGAFVHQAFLRAGVRLSARLIHPHLVYADAIAKRRNVRQIRKSDVRPGDLLLFSFRRGLKASHAAIVTTRPSEGRVRTVEGNVSHRVWAGRRGLRYAVMAVRVVP